MPDAAFPAHGYCHLHLEGQILHVAARGPWNREAIAEYRQELNQLVASMHGRPWGLLGSLQGEAFLLPEAAQLLRQGILNDQSRGRVATAYLLNDVVLSDLVQELFHRVFEGIDHQVQFFANAGVAQSWLTSRINAAQLA